MRRGARQIAPEGNQCPDGSPTLRALLTHFFREQRNAIPAQQIDKRRAVNAGGLNQQRQLRQERQMLLALHGVSWRRSKWGILETATLLGNFSAAPVLGTPSRATPDSA